MPIDPLSLAVGAVVALVPLIGGLWSLQRRLAREQGEQALLQERLEHVQLGQAGLLAQLDACRTELAEVSEIKVEQQTELAGLRRENELRATWIGFRPMEEADKLAHQQRVEAGIEFVDDQCQSFSKDVQHGACKE